MEHDNPNGPCNCGAWHTLPTTSSVSRNMDFSTHTVSQLLAVLKKGSDQIDGLLFAAKEWEIERTELQNRIAHIIKAIEEHGEGGNIEHFGLLMERIGEVR